MAPQVHRRAPQLGNVRAACQQAGVPRRTAYRHKARSPEFADDWDEAVEDACDYMEGEAFRRATQGVDKPVTVAGEREIIKDYSDSLLMFLLKAHRPGKFRERLDTPGRAAGRSRSTSFMTTTTGTSLLKLGVQDPMKGGAMTEPENVLSPTSPIHKDQTPCKAGLHGRTDLRPHESEGDPWTPRIPVSAFRALKGGLCIPLSRVDRYSVARAVAIPGRAEGPIRGEYVPSGAEAQCSCRRR